MTATMDVTASGLIAKETSVKTTNLHNIIAW